MTETQYENPRETNPRYTSQMCYFGKAPIYFSIPMTKHLKAYVIEISLDLEYFWLFTKPRLLFCTIFLLVDRFVYLHVVARRWMLITRTRFCVLSMRALPSGQRGFVLATNRKKPVN